MNYSQRELALAAGGVVLAIAVGIPTGMTPWLLLGVAGAWILYQHVELAQFLDWARRPLGKPVDQQSDMLASTAESLYRSVQAGRERTRNVLRRLDELQTITEALPDAAVVVDERGVIQRYNPAAKALFRLTADDVGRDLLVLVRDPALARLLKGDAVDDVVEFGSPFADGTRLEARRMAMGEGGGHLVIARDVTQLNRLLTMRQDFVANVSHELRTPLTVVTGYLETMLEGDLSAEELQDLVGRLKSPVQRLDALVDDLLLLTRLESRGELDEDSLPEVDMGALIDMAVATAEGLSTGRHDIRVPCRAPYRLRGSENELLSAIMNLVGNAVRYSPDGGRIEVAWVASEEGGTLTVRDHGMGIAPEHISRLTERFYRVDLHGSRVRGGTGLGLAIVKHVLNRHGATLTIASEPGEGSEFRCEFPASRLVPVAAVTTL